MKISSIIFFFLVTFFTQTQIAATAATEAQTFDSWALSCQSDQCFLSQSIATAADYRKTVLGITIGIQQEKLHIRFRFTAYAIPESGVSLDIDANHKWNLPISKCDQKICEADSTLDPIFLENMKQNDKMFFSFQHKNGKRLTYPISLIGFNKALDALNKSK